MFKLSSEYNKHTADVRCVCEFITNNNNINSNNSSSGDEVTVTSGSRDTTVRVWNAKSGEDRRELVGHSHFVAAVLSLPASSLFLAAPSLASGGSDKLIYIWLSLSF